ncbi:MAG: hypothetical protein H0X40_07775 [Chthoniobacterales bacterium]|nr:hypothetical protein [Chthoniobacterales bacterium]
MEDVSIEGKWWIFGAEAPPQFGALTNSDGLRLSVKVPQDLSIGETMGEPVRFGQDTSVPEIIVGRNAHNRPVTLFGCFALPAISAGLKTYDIQAIAGVEGLEFETWGEKGIFAASLDIEMLHSWLGDKVLKQSTIEGGESVWSEISAKDLVVDVTPEIQMRIVRFVAISEEWSEYRFSGKPRVWLHFKFPQSLYDVSNRWIPFVVRFFSLLVGVGLRYNAVEVYKDDPYAPNFEGLPVEGTIIRSRQARRTKKEIITPFMLASYPRIATQFTEIVQKWAEVDSKLGPVIDLFAIVALRDRRLHADAEFLFLVQALEVYHARMFDSKALPTEEHRRRVDAIVDAAPEALRNWTLRKLRFGNYKYLDERIAEVFQRHEDEARQLFDDVEQLPEKIRYTRNHLTHHSADIDSPKYLKAPAMAQVNFYLRVFLWVCLLKETGAPRDAINRLIGKHRDAKFVNLS